MKISVFSTAGFRSRSIWVEPKPSLWVGSGSGSSCNFSYIIHANCMVQSFDIFSREKSKLVTIYIICTSVPICCRHIVNTIKKKNYVLKSKEKNPGAGAASKQDGYETLLHRSVTHELVCTYSLHGGPYTTECVLISKPFLSLSYLFPIYIFFYIY